MNELVAVFAHGAAKRAGIQRGFAGQNQQSTHVDADQFGGSNPDHRGQRAIHAQDLVVFIVDHNEVADGVKDFQPVAVRLLDASEEARIFQSDRSVSCNGVKQFLVLLQQRLTAISETQHTHQIA